MDCNKNFYWASFRAACYAAVVLFLASNINSCYTRNCAAEHNCEVRCADAMKALSSSYQTNVVVRRIKTGDKHDYYDVNNTKLLLYKEADMKFGSGSYVLKMAEYEPCRKHGGPMRIYYTVAPKTED